MAQRYSKGKNCVFIQFSTRNGWLAASGLFDMFTQLIKSYYTLYNVYYEYRCLKNMIDSKNEWLLPPASFTANFGKVFVLTLETLFLRGFILKSTERE